MTYGDARELLWISKQRDWIVVVIFTTDAFWLDALSGHIFADHDGCCVPPGG